eukprot:466624_1
MDKYIINSIFIEHMKGVIIGRLHSKQREFEINIMKLVFDNLNIKYNEIPKLYNGNECYLESGDFTPINANLSMLGIGLRANICAAQYLMDNDLIGTDRFAVVVDKNDKQQCRMHLDMFFNILNDSISVNTDSYNNSCRDGFNIEGIFQIDGQYAQSNVFIGNAKSYTGIVHVN